MVCDVLQTNIEDLQLTTVAPTLNIFKEKKREKNRKYKYTKNKKKLCENKSSGYICRSHQNVPKQCKAEKKFLKKERNVLTSDGELTKN